MIPKQLLVVVFFAPLIFIDGLLHDTSMENVPSSSSVSQTPDAKITMQVVSECEHNFTVMIATCEFQINVAIV